jgi:hypothetical protein
MQLAALPCNTKKICTTKKFERGFFVAKRFQGHTSHEREAEFGQLWLFSFIFRNFDREGGGGVDLSETVTLANHVITAAGNEC